MEAAAKSNLKRVSLELGGKSPNVVFADADLDAAVEGAYFGLFFNQGQCCCAGSRLFVEEKVHDQFVEKMRAKGEDAQGRRSVRPGDRRKARRCRRSNATASWATSNPARRKAPRCSSAARRRGDKGYFVEPTVFGNVTDEMKIAKEEIFGPVMNILKFKDVDEVIERGNQTFYGLAAGRLDARHRQGAPPRQRAPGRHGLDQLLRRFRRGRAVRRLQDVRHRPRTRRIRPPTVHGSEDGVREP